LGKAARRPSILIRDMSTNCLETSTASEPTQKISSKATHKTKKLHYNNTVTNINPKSNPRLTSSTNERTSSTNIAPYTCSNLNIYGNHRKMPPDTHRTHDAQI